MRQQETAFETPLNIRVKDRRAVAVAVFYFFPCPYRHFHWFGILKNAPQVWAYGKTESELRERLRRRAEEFFNADEMAELPTRWQVGEKDDASV